MSHPFKSFKSLNPFKPQLRAQLQAHWRANSDAYERDLARALTLPWPLLSRICRVTLMTAGIVPGACIGFFMGLLWGFLGGVLLGGLVGGVLWFMLRALAYTAIYLVPNLFACLARTP